MLRAHHRDVFFLPDATDRVRPVQAALVRVFEDDGVTPVAGMFAAASGGAAITQLETNNQGELEFYLDAAKTVVVKIADNGGLAKLPGTGAAVTFAEVTETVDILPSPKDLPTAVNAKASGAKGDGATNDSAILQGLLDALDTAEGGELFCPAGTYLVENLVGKSRVRLRGVPGKTIFKLPNGSTGGIITATDATDFLVEGITFDLNKANTTDGGTDTAQNGINIVASASDVTGVAIRNCRIKDGHQNGIRCHAPGPTGTRKLEVTIEGNEITGCRFGVRTYRGTKIRIRGNKVTGSALEGINCLGGQNDLIALNDSSGNTNQGIVVTAQGVDISQGARVIGNTCNSNGTNVAANLGWGINISLQSRHFTIAGNVCRDNFQGGITIDVRTAIGAPDRDSLQPTDGSVTGNAVEGFSGTNATIGINTNYVNGLSVTGNTVEGAANDGIQILGRNCVVEGNVLRNCGAWGVDINNVVGTTPAMGEHKVGPNVYDGNTTGRLQIVLAIRDTVVNLETESQARTLSATEFDIEDGTPTLGEISTSTVHGWLLDAATLESVCTVFQVPRGWTKMRATYLWCNRGGGAGDVRFQLSVKRLSAGDVLTEAATTSTATPTAGADLTVMSTQMVASQAVTPGELLNVRAARDGVVAADTLPNDVALLAVVLEPDMT